MRAPGRIAWLRARPSASPSPRQDPGAVGERSPSRTRTSSSAIAALIACYGERVEITFGRLAPDLDVATGTSRRDALDDKHDVVIGRVEPSKRENSHKRNGRFQEPPL